MVCPKGSPQSHLHVHILIKQSFSNTHDVDVTRGEIDGFQTFGRLAIGPGLGKYLMKTHVGAQGDAFLSEQLTFLSEILGGVNVFYFYLGIM